MDMKIIMTKDPSMRSLHRRSMMTVLSLTGAIGGALANGREDSYRGTRAGRSGGGRGANNTSTQGWSATTTQQGAVLPHRSWWQR